jgi:hypothetical protein
MIKIYETTGENSNCAIFRPLDSPSSFEGTHTTSYGGSGIQRNFFALSSIGMVVPREC